MTLKEDVIFYRLKEQSAKSEVFAKIRYVRKFTQVQYVMGIYSHMENFTYVSRVQLQGEESNEKLIVHIKVVV